MGCFIFWLLGSAVVTAETHCTLCDDGSPIARPNFVLDLTQPVPLKTCQDLSNTLVLLPGESDLCSNARSLAALCGCPKSSDFEEACTICESMTRPKQVLDGLVDLGDRNTFGMERTCELVESSLNTLSKDSQDCPDLLMDDLRSYCGCEVSMDASDSNECSFCPGGEIVKDTVGEIVLTLHEEPTTCSELQRVANDSAKGTKLCTKVQELSTGCGCPIPSNACQLCGPKGVMLGTEQQVFYRGEKMSCSTMKALLQSFEENSHECLAINERYRIDCKCSEEREFVPCTLCPGGEDVPLPDKYIHGLEGLGFDYVEHTCGLLDRLARNADESSRVCSSTRILSKVCGCKVPETSCSICGNNGVMSYPEREFYWTFGTMSDNLPQFSVVTSETIDTDRRWSCEVAESFLAHSYDQDDFVCYTGHLLKGSGCGCPRDPYVTVLLWSQRCSGFLSLVGSLFIIVSTLRSRRTNRFSTFNQIILCISIFDSLCSLSYILGTAMIPKEMGHHGSIGNDTTCYFQTWLLQVGITSVFYSVLLSLYFLMVVKYDWNESRFQKLQNWAHGAVCGLGFGLSFAALPFSVPGWRWCYLNRPPVTASWLPGMFLFILPIGLSILAMIVITVVFVLHVREVEGKIKRKKLGGGNTNQSLTSRTFWQSVWFLMIYFVVWPIQFISFVIKITSSTYWLYLLAAVLGPLQGLLNAIVWKRRLIAKGASRLFEVTYRALASFSSTIQGSDGLGSSWKGFFSGQFIKNYRNDGANEEEHHTIASAGQHITPPPLLHPAAEHCSEKLAGSLNSEEIAQLDVSIGDISPFPKGDECGDGIFKNSGRGLWEHAVNSGLLDDDDDDDDEGEICQDESRPSP